MSTVENILVEGTVAFSNLTKTDFYNGKDTGRYNLVCTLDPQEAQKLEDKGVKIRDYEGTPQRKFPTKFRVVVVDTNDEPINTEIPYGSRVRMQVELGPDNPMYGVPTYLKRVRVLEMAEGSAEGALEDF